MTQKRALYFYFWSQEFLWEEEMGAAMEEESSPAEKLKSKLQGLGHGLQVVLRTLQTDTNGNLIEGQTWCRYHSRP